MVTGQNPPGHVPPGHLPQGHIPPGHLPLDTYPLDIYPLGHIPPGHLPPGHLPPGHLPPRTYIPQDIYPPDLKCPIWFMHHVLITYCTLKSIYFAEIAFICDVGAIKLTYICLIIIIWPSKSKVCASLICIHKILHSRLILSYTLLKEILFSLSTFLLILVHSQYEKYNIDIYTGK